MRRFFVITACFSIMSSLIAQTNFPFIEEGKIWADLSKTASTPPPGGGERAWTDYYKFEQDTLIQGKIYHFLYICEKDSTMTNWVREDYYYREDSNRVYRIDWLENEIQIYNFDLEVGDSIFMDSFYEYAHVVAIDSTMIAGDYRKTIHFDTPDDIWIAGLGSLYRTFEPLIYYFMTNRLYELLCVSDSTGKLYQNPSYNGCYVDTLLTEKYEIITTKPEIVVFPNPFSNACSIKISVSKEIFDRLLLVDNLGRIVRDEVINTNSFIFERRDLAPGFYIMKFLGKNRTLNKNILIN
jgi:hypothetical protein